jgi:hypothetical protein
MKKLIRIAAGLIVAQLAGAALAQSVVPKDWWEGKKLSFQISPYVYHFTYDSEHKDSVMVGLEREHPDARLDGVVVFTNSFGQPSIYVYPVGGAFHDLLGVKGLSFKWTAGVMYGYVEPYEDKVPFNYKGFSPVILPALAYEFTPGWTAQLDLLGTAGLMIQLNVELK